jgi:radical SAM superfamily enzyme YgiQ (UPF0313 family)
MLRHLLPSFPARPRIGDILLINPRYERNPCSSAGRHALAPSLALPLIAAATPAGYTVRFFDENLSLRDAPLHPLPEVVGITVHTAFARRAYALADRYRRAGARVVLGGLHVTALPAEARPHADVVVVGDGVPVWPEVLAGLRNGSLRGGRVVHGSFVSPGYAEAPWPRRDILPRGAFLTTGAIIATRGCVQRCAFCYLATRGVRAPYQRRPVADVLAEIDALEEPFVVFTDNNIAADRDYLLELCRQLRPRRLMWTAAATIDVARDASVVAAMAAAGCHGVFVGLETLADESLAAQRKHTLQPVAYRRAISLLHDHGIEVNGSFVFGFDADGPDVFDRTLEFIVEERLECATFHILTPYPGTPLYESLDAQGRILTRDWSQYDTAHVVFRPARLTPEQLLEGYQRAYRQLYSWPTIVARAPRGASLLSTSARVTAYLAMTLLYKKADWIWRGLVPLRLTRAAWRPLIEAHRLLARRAAGRCGTLPREQGGQIIPLPHAA